MEFIYFGFNVHSCSVPSCSHCSLLSQAFEAAAINVSDICIVSGDSFMWKGSFVIKFNDYVAGRFFFVLEFGFFAFFSTLWWS